MARVVAWAFAAILAWIVVLARRADPGSYRRLWLCSIALVGWVVLAFAFAGLLAYEHSDVSATGSLGCDIAHEDSSFAQSHWSWLPPGEVCEYASGDHGPSKGRVAYAVALLALPISVGVVWTRKRQSALANGPEYL